MSYRQFNKNYKNYKSHKYGNNNTNSDLPSNANYYDPSKINFPEVSTPRLNYYGIPNQSCNTNSFNKIRININNNNFTPNPPISAVLTESIKSNPLILENPDKRKNELSVEEALKFSSNIEFVNLPEKKLKAEQNSTNSGIRLDAKCSRKIRLLKELESYGKDSAKVEREVNELLVDYRRLAEETTKKYDAYREKKIQQKTLKAKMKKICQAIEIEDDSESDTPNIDPVAVAVADSSSSRSSHGSDVQLVVLPRPDRQDSRNISSSSSSSSSNDSDIQLVAVDESNRRFSISSSSSDDSDDDSSSSDVEVVSGPPPITQPPASSNSDVKAVSGPPPITQPPASSSSDVKAVSGPQPITQPPASSNSDVKVVSGPQPITQPPASSNSDVKAVSGPPPITQPPASSNSDVKAVSGPPPITQPPASSDSGHRHQKTTSVVNGNTTKPDQVHSARMDIKESPQTKPSLSTGNACNPKITCNDSFVEEKPESKINIKNTIPECVDIPPKADLSNSLPVMVKADEQNGLFHAIEPKLNTIIISDEEKTFITDINVFNNRLFVSASHGLLRQYHLGTHECIMDYKGHQSLIHCLLPTVLPIGAKRILSGGFDKALFVHDIDTGAILHKIENDSAILSICDLLDFVYYGTAGGNVATFSLEKNRRMSSFHASDGGISCVNATKEGNVHLLFVGANNCEYSVWNAITYVKLKIITPVSHLEIPIDFIVLQKQRLLAYTKNHVHFIQYVKTKSTSSFNHFDSISSLCLTRNYVIIGGLCGKVSVYKIKGSHIPKTPIRTIVNSNTSVISLTFYNNTIISGDKTGKVYFNRLVES